MRDQDKTKEQLLDELGALRARLSTMQRDAVECDEMEAHLIESESRFRIMADSAPVFIWMSDAGTGRNYFNKVWLDYTGKSLSEEANDGWLKGVHLEDYQRCRDICSTSHQQQEQFRLEYRLRRRDGVYRWILDTGNPRFTSENKFIGFIGSCVGITEKKEAEERLKYIAHFDVLTGLPNRMLFFDRLEQAIVQAKRYSYLVALLYVDLNRFKHINDTYGHQIGDLVLRESAKRLCSCMRDADTVARIGGDEFNVILSRVGEKNDVQHIAEKIIAAMNRPFYFDGIECFIGVSIGISLYPHDARDTDMLIKKADSVMYQVKALGRSDFMFCS
ncbi:PAS/PAC and GAF sensor-containing diguanylate cyclase/phosphodiesterase [Candidatus Magnetobacterium bavaricum]|uniref:PAS/PAC and GAF sensor-containing diguanylate cyclase/phosphodiesterase n=1 Tax=Candidatus Magnetobacterium bavaricum TaxID=29290 RepID=A0A0F3GXD7_9BACT|nr:PAS/PAC and GAF sensor-containing diguanylate cyclase/phosphodiesterase [Candidatus Magnetobacterium bavaricum]